MKHMVTTFGTTECNSDPVIAALNRKLGGARYHVENAFAILKSRFQIFARPLQCASHDVRLAVVLTCSTFVLHNFLIDVRDEAEWEGMVNAVAEMCHHEDAQNEPHEDNNDVLATWNILIRHMHFTL